MGGWEHGEGFQGVCWKSWKENEVAAEGQQSSEDVCILTTRTLRPGGSGALRGDGMFRERGADGRTDVFELGVMGQCWGVGGVSRAQPSPGAGGGQLPAPGAGQ